MKITFEIVFWGSLLDLAPNSSIPTSISLTFFRFFLWQNSSYIDVSKDLKVQFRVTRYEKDMKGSYLVHTWLVFGSYSHLFWSFDPSPSLHQGCIAHASGLGIHIISTWGKKWISDQWPDHKATKFHARSAVKRRRTALQRKHQTPELLVVRTEHTHGFCMHKYTQVMVDNFSRKANLYFLISDLGYPRYRHRIEK